MCGIAVVRARDPGGRIRLLTDVLGAIRHRGQPDCGHQVSDLPTAATALGANRLAIVGADAGHQPVLSPGGRLAVVFNGEVFNHGALARELGVAGSGQPALGRTLPESDTAVLAAAIERWGPRGAVERLVWEGAFVCVDTRTGELWAGRDHLGIKPLYWTLTRDATVWASEIKALVPHASETIEPLPPGSLACLRPGRPVDPVVTTWWRPEEYASPGGPAAREPAEVVDQLSALVRDAVTARVPEGGYAVALSGGVDSSLVLRLAIEANERATAYVLGHPGSPDLPYARRLCDQLGVPLVAVPAAAPGELLDQLPEVIRTVETWEWHVVNHAAPMTALMAAIRADGHRVVLTGEGADELFAGYGQPAGSPAAGHLASERLDRLRHLHRTNCRRLDRIGMAATIECRVPLLDRSLTEFALGVDEGWLRRDGSDKWVLREVAARVLPDRFALRRKLSFARGVGYQYSPTGSASVFGTVAAGAALPPAWTGLARYPVERAFLGQFLAHGYGKASYLRSRSR
jgi:asparagine synthase (glutamine-hydrolysing)